MKTAAMFLSVLFMLLLAACNKPAQQYFQGYVEGEWLYLSAPQGGYLDALYLARGQHVDEGAAAFLLSGEQGSTQAARRSAALQAQLRAAESAFKLATAQLKRQEELARQNFVAEARVDELLTAQSQANAQVRILREQLLNKSVMVPARGEVSELFYRQGEWVPAGQPVFSLLPDDRRRIRFFVPEDRLSQLAMGQVVQAHCDGCAAPVPAKINFISAQAEYTPPVIYSQGAREKLVFRVEAQPSAQDALRLRPGLPVEVRLQ